MTIDEILRLVEMMGVRRAQTHATYVMIPCPLAAKNHKKGYDSDPSASIRADPVQSLWHCFSCGRGGNLTNMVYQWAEIGRVDPYPLADYIDAKENPLNVVCTKLDQAWNDKWVPAPPVGPDVSIFEESELDAFRRSAPQYILDRGISITSCREWGIRFDPGGNGTGHRPRVVFPVRRPDGALVGAVGRALDDIKKQKYINYWNFPKSHYLFGEDKVKGQKMVVVVEGMIDTIKWWEYGIPTVGLMGADPSAKQIDRILSYPKVCLALDQDDAGMAGMKKLAYRIKDQVGLFTVPIPEGMTDPKQLSFEEAHSAVNSSHRIL